MVCVFLLAGLFAVTLFASDQNATMYSIITTLLPAVIIASVLVLTIAITIARRLTRRIMAPVNNIFTSNTESKTTYEEFWPYFSAIAAYKADNEEQLHILRTRAETIEAIIANMQEGLVLLDERGNVLSVNKAVKDIFNLSERAELIHKNFIRIYRDPEFTDAVKRCLKGEHLERSFSRNEKKYMIYFNPVFSDGKNNGAVIFFIDMTNQHKAEAQRREFSANVSHELKTPLTSISALSEMMAHGMIAPEDVQRSAEKILEHSTRLVYVINDIIRLSEFDESKAKSDFTTFDIFQVAHNIVESLRDRALENNIELLLVGAPTMVTADARLLDELMSNLLINGIKYNTPGGECTLSINTLGDICEISVSDTGIGIPEDKLEHVFERFYRVDSSRSKQTGGTGLGLSIVKHITEHHKGKIELKSKLDHGTTITCYIPIKPIDEVRM